jgi:hypothetical protein
MKMQSIDEQYQQQKQAGLPDDRLHTLMTNVRQDDKTS